jgi:hypothetical protein
MDFRRYTARPNRDYTFPLRALVFVFISTCAVEGKGGVRGYMYSLAKLINLVTCK